MKLSAFEIKPKFHISEKMRRESQYNTPVVVKYQIAQWARDLNRLVEKTFEREKNQRPSLKKNKRRGKKY